jgi:ABC-type transport system substrate-binding protein
MLIAIVIVVIIIIGAVAAVLLTSENKPTPKPTNWLDRGFSMEIYYNAGNTARATACQVLKNNLESLNPGKIHITVTGVEWAVYLQKQRAGAMPAFFLGWAPDFADPTDYTVPFLLSGGTYLRALGYDNATLDAAVIHADSQLDETARAAEYRQISLDVQKECIYVWVAQSKALDVMRSSIGGFEANPMYSNLYYYLLNKSSAVSGGSAIDTFTYGEISGNPDYFDPARDYETAGGEVLQNVFETLVFYDGAAADAFIPLLCTEVPTIANGGISADGLNYTFHLKEHVLFHDGFSEMTAADVKYSMARELRFNDPFGPGWIIGEVLVPNYYSFGAGVFNATNITAGSGCPMSAIDQHIVVINDTTIEFKLVAPDPAFISRLAFNGASILSLNNTMANSGGHPYSEASFTFVNENPIGTGPYKLREFTSGSHIALDRFDAYHRGPANITHVLLEQVASDNARISGIISGQFDGAAIPRAQQQSLYGQSGVVLSNASTFNVDFLGLNQAINKTGLNPTLNDIPSNFFSDVRVRQAFAHAWDFATFNAQALAGQGVQPNGVIPQGMFGYNGTIPQYAHNNTQAAALLKAVPLPAGYSSAKTVLEGMIVRD